MRESLGTPSAPGMSSDTDGAQGQVDSETTGPTLVVEMPMCQPQVESVRKVQQTPVGQNLSFVR